MTLDVQFITMVTMVMGGVYLGIVQETLRRLQHYWYSNRFLRYWMEVTFWLVQVVVLFYALFLVNGGELRVYVFLALFLGFAIYQALIKSFYKWLLDILLQICHTFLRFVQQVMRVVVLLPVMFMLQAVWTVIMALGRILLWVLLSVWKLIYTPVKWVITVIYRLLPQTIQKNLDKLAGFCSTIKNICKKVLNYIKKKRR